MFRSFYLRAILSAVFAVIFGFALNTASLASHIGAGTIAGDQLQNSNSAAFVAQSGVSAFHMLPGIATGIFMLLLLLIWVPVIIRISKGNRLASFLALGMGLALFGMSTQPAFAYYDTQDKAEAVGIPPNSTAFWIPDQGNTQANQQQTDDASFYNSHTVPGKIFIVPHSIFQNSGGVHAWDADYYVPDGRLILVDRTPVSREWTSAEGTGTSTQNQGFECQSNDGLTIKTAMTAIVSIQPQDAATYLYYFGTDPIVPNPNDSYMSANPNADPSNDPNVIFSSVYHARALAEVMDTTGHSLVEAAVCEAIGANDLQTDNKDYNAIMTQVQKTATDYLQQRGITVDVMGWAGTFTFDPDVQKAINNLFIAQTVQPVLPALQASAGITAIQSWDGHLPASLTLLGQDQSMGGLLTGLISAKTALQPK